MVNVDSDKPILWVLRDELGLTGSKYGCGIGICGSCVIHIDGEPARSCVLPVSNVGSRAITTVERLLEDENNPIIQAWEEKNVSQCGYCQAGVIMSTSALLRQNSSPTDDEIWQALSGNICRCGTYFRIMKAIKSIK